MADAPKIPNGMETRTSTRHAELVSASIVPLRGQRQDYKWTLKQVQGDQNGGVV